MAAECGKGMFSQDQVELMASSWLFKRIPFINYNKHLKKELVVDLNSHSLFQERESPLTIAQLEHELSRVFDAFEVKYTDEKRSIRGSSWSKHEECLIQILEAKKKRKKNTSDKNAAAAAQSEELSTLEHSLGFGRASSSAVNINIRLLFCMMEFDESTITFIVLYRMMGQ
jgi:hypothetical protein